ncbi:unnamed protein product [Rotaria sp. Silwood2]|nr:unnamed protein product [Rotaria sp. Silwood2]CAF4444019.1 unnamed protein product [Rotaria sp. Silwood2]
MYHFSHKVNKRRRVRQIKRQAVRQLIVGENSSDDCCVDNYSEQFSVTYDQQQQINVEKCSMIINNEPLPFSASANTADDNVDWTIEDEYENDARPLFHGSPISITDAINRITNFYLSLN